MQCETVADFTEICMRDPCEQTHDLRSDDGVRNPALKWHWYCSERGHLTDVNDQSIFASPIVDEPSTLCGNDLSAEHWKSL